MPEQALLRELPLQLRGEAVNCFLESVFKGLEVFRYQRRDVLTLLASCLHPHTTLPGHNLSREGSPADRLWILQKGLSSSSCSGLVQSPPWLIFQCPTPHVFCTVIPCWAEASPILPGTIHDQKLSCA